MSLRGVVRMFLWLLGEYEVASLCIFLSSVQLSSVVQSCPTLCNPMDSPWGCKESQGSSCPLPTLGVNPNSCPFHSWCYPTISSSVIPFSSHLQSFPASGSFQMSQFFTSGCQSIGVSASTLVLSVNIQDWFPLGWTSWIPLRFRGLSRVFNITVQSHQYFSTQLSL